MIWAWARYQTPAACVPSAHFPDANRDRKPELVIVTHMPALAVWASVRVKQIRLLAVWSGFHFLDTLVGRLIGPPEHLHTLVAIPNSQSLAIFHRSFSRFRLADLLRFMAATAIDDVCWPTLRAVRLSTPIEPQLPRVPYRAVRWPDSEPRAWRPFVHALIELFVRHLLLPFKALSRPSATAAVPFSSLSVSQGPRQRHKVARLRQRLRRRPA